MKKKDVYNKAKAIWGIDAQVTKAVEELAELQKELCKFLLDDAKFENIIEEVADVKIMVEQIELMFEIKEAVKAVKKKKIQRLSDRLDKEEEINESCGTCRFENTSLSRNPCNECRELSNYEKTTYAE